MRSLIKNKPFLIVIALATLSIISLLLLPKQTAQPPTESTIVSPLQKTRAGITTADEIESLSDVRGKIPLPNGDTEYNLSSPLRLRPNEIITRNGVAIFERIDLPEDQKAAGYSTISQFLQSYGQPEKVIEGSEFFGPFASTYVYANKGFAFIGNTYTNEVYEIQTFTPRLLNDYINEFGQDVNEEEPPEEPLHP